MHDFVANISAQVKIKSQVRVTSLHWAEKWCSPLQSGKFAIMRAYLGCFYSTVPDSFPVR